MTQFSVNTHRVNPYGQFKFRVRWDGRIVAGISYVSGLERHTEVVEYREGGQPNIHRKAPALTSFTPIVLKRGITHDTAFEQWANLVWNPAGNPEIALKDFRKDILIELLNETGQVVLVYKAFRCWPSEYSPVSDLDANAAAVAMETLVLEYEGWERDTSVAEPMEPGAGASNKRKR
jgi:phage tail-like protein